MKDGDVTVGTMPSAGYAEALDEKVIARLEKDMAAAWKARDEALLARGDALTRLEEALKIAEFWREVAEKKEERVTQALDVEAATARRSEHRSDRERSIARRLASLRKAYRQTQSACERWKRLYRDALAERIEMEKSHRLREGNLNHRLGSALIELDRMKSMGGMK